MREQLTIIAGLVALVVAPVAVQGQAAGQKQAADQKRSVASRGYSRFELESATVDGLWAELGALYDNTNTDITNFPTQQVDDLDRANAFARFAYGGGNMWEGGVLLPFYSADGEVNGKNIDATGVGDVQLSGKFIPLRTSVVTFGGGLLMTLPTGDEDDGFGTGEVGGGPFLTMGVNLAILELRGHAGWEFLAGDHDKEINSDRLLYGFGIHVPIGDYVAVRNEFVGVRLDSPDNPTEVNYLGGFDFRLPIGNFDLLFRPTGTVGVTNRAPDWGVGASIAFTSPTYKSAKAPKMVGGIVIEE